MSSAPSTSCADCFPTSQERSQKLKLCPRFPIVDRSPLQKSAPPAGLEEMIENQQRTPLRADR
jgi:hypothetical protein